MYGLMYAMVDAFDSVCRTQSAVGNMQFLRSMIPHRSGAILMCEKAAIRNPGIKDLCKTVIAGEAAEIRQMKAKLASLSQ